LDGVNLSNLPRFVNEMAFLKTGLARKKPKKGTNKCQVLVLPIDTS